MKQLLLLLVVSLFSSNSAQNSRNCHAGSRNFPQSHNRIVGGSNARLGQFPWQAAIFSRTTRGTLKQCGGVIITRNHVLTAAHCVEKPSVTRVESVNVGITNLNNIRRANRYSVRTVTIHPNRMRSDWTNDLAILRTSKPMRLNSNVQTICLASSQDELNADDTVVVSGFGRYSSNNPVHRQLKYVSLKFMGWQECKRKIDQFSGPGSMWQWHNNVLCTYRPRKDFCAGDSGGPLVKKFGPNNTLKLIGIVSWNSKTPCGNTQRRPSVFMGIKQQLTWLRRVVPSISVG